MPTFRERATDFLGGPRFRYERQQLQAQAAAFRAAANYAPFMVPTALGLNGNRFSL